jgi:glycosyltransferase involved in cell wall biosynthesis
VKVAVVAEYYPRPAHPGLGIWAHRQARAVRDLGVDVRVLVLERPLPPMVAFKALVPGRGGQDAGFSRRRPDARPLREWASSVWDPPRDMVLDGVPVRYVRFVSPPRPISYASWGWWAARPVKRALDELHRQWPFDLVHAHYAVPAGDAVLRWLDRRARLPFVVSVHGGDLFYTAERTDHGRRVVSRVFEAADAILANSDLTRRGIEGLGAAASRVHVVHPGADPGTGAPSRHADPTLVTVANLEAHKSQADVIRAVAALRDRHPRLRYLVIGRGPDRHALEVLADSLGVGDRVRFTGGLSHDDALAELARCHVHVMPSRIDGFGVAHIEAMASGLPTIGAVGTGAEDIARSGEGALLVRAGDITGLVRVIDELLSDDARRERLGEQARKTVSEHYSWPGSGERTEAVYRSLSSAHDG